MDQQMEKTFHEQEPGSALLKAVKTFLKRDSYLLEVDANERSITSLIARYLADELPQFDVDCEYNRDGIDPKKLRYLDLHPDEEDTYARTVFPDIIAHRRGTLDNYFVLEVKKTTNPDGRDIDLEKLTGYKRQLGYRFAAFLELAAEDHADVTHLVWV